MRYLGKSHNLWYRMSLSLEQLAVDSGSLQLVRPKKEAADQYDFEPSANNKEVGTGSPTPAAPDAALPLCLLSIDSAQSTHAPVVQCRVCVCRGREESV